MKIYTRTIVLIGCAAVFVLSPKKPAVPAVPVVQAHAVTPAPPATVQPPAKPKCLPGYKADMPCIPFDDIQKEMQQHRDNKESEPVRFDPKLRTT